MITASTLQHASREEILAMFLQFIEESQRKIDALEKRVAELEGRGKPKGGSPYFKPAVSPKRGKPGRPHGHEGESRAVPDKVSVDVVLETRLDGCPDCGGHVERRGRVEQYVEEVIPARTEIRKHVDEHGFCPQCRKWVRSRHRDAISDATGAAGVMLGPRATALAAMMKHELRGSYRKVADHLHANHGLEVTHGALAQAMSRLGDRLRPVYDMILERLRTSPAVNVDETGWRLHGRNAWMWVVANRSFTIYEIADSRAGRVALELLGPDYAGTVGCDCFSAYSPLPYEQQKCLVHILRELNKVAQTTASAEYLGFYKMMKRILKDALRLKERSGQVGYSKMVVARRDKRLERRMDHALSCHWENEDCIRIAALLRKHRSSLFTFLRHAEVEGHNNLAERALRPRVIQRKTCGGNRTRNGATATAIVTSVLETCRKQGLNFVDTVAEYLRRAHRGEGFDYINRLLPAPSG